MIRSFGNQLAQDLFDDKKTKHTRQFPSELYRVARRKILYLHDAEELMDLRVPPGNKLEALKGNLKGYNSIRINDQWRVIFVWTDGGPSDVQVLDYH
jgi:proteic killer suppression protein